MWSIQILMRAKRAAFVNERIGITFLKHHQVYKMNITLKSWTLPMQSSFKLEATLRKLVYSGEFLVSKYPIKYRLVSSISCNSSRFWYSLMGSLFCSRTKSTKLSAERWPRYSRLAISPLRTYLIVGYLVIWNLVPKLPIKEINHCTHKNAEKSHMENCAIKNKRKMCAFKIRYYLNVNTSIHLSPWVKAPALH